MRGAGAVWLPKGEKRPWCEKNADATRLCPSSGEVAYVVLREVGGGSVEEEIDRVENLLERQGTWLKGVRGERWEPEVWEF